MGAEIQNIYGSEGLCPFVRAYLSKIWTNTALYALQ